MGLRPGGRRAGAALTPAAGGTARRVSVLGVGVSCVDLAGAVDRMAGFIERGERRYVCVTGMHGVMASRRDPWLRDVHNASGMTTPDGMPMVWAAHRAGAPATRRVYGPDLMEAFSERAAAAGYPVALVGGRPGVATAAARRLAARHRGLAVVACESPPFPPGPAGGAGDGVDRALVARLNAARPAVVWVGLGTPRQERWMARYRPLLDAPVLVGVGAAFDFLAGTLRQAPPWLQRAGLEWAWRLAHEPRRLWRRYLGNIPVFAWCLWRHPPVLVPDDAGAAGPGAHAAAMLRSPRR